MKVYDALLRDGKAKRAAAGQSIPGEDMNAAADLLAALKAANRQCEGLEKERDVFARAIDTLNAECLALTTERDALRADVHSCHTGCTRAGCVNVRLRTQIAHYEAALKAAWPEGAKGASWESWNEARKIDRDVRTTLEKTKP